MEDCHLETILVNKKGFASQCKGCGRINLGFGNVLLIFYPDNFKDFLEGLQGTYTSRENLSNGRLVKDIIIPSTITEVSLIFCLEELKFFIEFMEKIESALAWKSLARDAASNPN